MSLCLVTGGTGFVGSHLVEALLARRHTVRVLDGWTTGRLANLSRVPARVELIWGDFGDTEVARQALDGVELVFHQAPADGPDWRSATRSFLAAARDGGVRRVVAAVPDAAGPAFDPAGLRADGLSVVWLRYGTVLGPRFAPTGRAGHALREILDDVLAGRPPVPPREGTVDIIDVADVVEANLLAAAAPGAGGQVYPVENGEPLTWRELVGLLSRLPGHADPWPPARPDRDAARSAGGGPAVWTDIGFRPLIPVHRCLSGYLASCLPDPAGPGAAPSLSRWPRGASPVPA
jgi:UDP-glucose 4-epimerase